MKLLLIVLALLCFGNNSIIIHAMEGVQNNQPYEYSRWVDPTPTLGLLYPRESESREVRTLDGIWQFTKSSSNDPMQGVRERWYKQDLQKVRSTQQMPVPASYNDITTDDQLRDHVGTVWYERKFYVPRSWELDQRVFLRFGSVHYASIVWLNGEQVMSHTIGHLPFEAEVTAHVIFGGENRITVLCDNTLINTTVPQGTVQQQPSDNGDVLVQTYTFDFFNYAGIHRSVHLYTTPKLYIQDVHIRTELLLLNRTGLIHFNVSTNAYTDNKKNINYDDSLDPLYVHLQVRQKTGEIVAHAKVPSMFTGTLIVPKVKLWWPYLMHADPGYLYTLEIYLHGADDSLLDVYRMNVGIRSLHWTNTTMMMNGKPLYLHGFGRHEDSDIRGKGLDLALLTRDFNLLKWIGANTYRTSHYPYSEESMQFADEHGIMIIDECSSVNTDIFQPQLLTNHKSALEQLIHRDRNHPSVIAWSVSNEPRSQHKQAEQYFGLLTNYTKQVDPTRPITAAINVVLQNDKLAQFLDIICFNRYNGWYANPGRLDMIINNVVEEATAWHMRYNKPIIMTEYGADTMEGMHSWPIYIWSEEYQYAVLSKHFEAFDTLRSQEWFIGEFVWNFADFKTEQNFIRVGGNKKGIFTRNRQPKGAAFLLRQRYHAIANALHHIDLPSDLFSYIIDWRNNLKDSYNVATHNEL